MLHYEILARTEASFKCNLSTCKFIHTTSEASRRATMDGWETEGGVSPKQENDEHGRGKNLQRLHLWMKDTGGELGQHDLLQPAAGRVCFHISSQHSFNLMPVLDEVPYYSLVWDQKEPKYGIKATVGEAKLLQTYWEDMQRKYDIIKLNNNWY